MTLELALAGVPTVAAYRITFIEEIIARVARIKQRLSSVILANLVLGENIVPELLQHDCTPERLAEAFVPLLSDTPEWRRQIEAFARLDDIMALKTVPSAQAAAVVLNAARTGPWTAPASRRRVELTACSLRRGITILPSCHREPRVIGLSLRSTGE